MSSKRKRTSALAPMEILPQQPLPVPQQPLLVPQQPLPVPQQPVLVPQQPLPVPLTLFPSPPTQSMSSAPWCRAGHQHLGLGSSTGHQQLGLAGSSPQGSSWMPPASASCCPVAENDDDCEVQIWGPNPYPPGGFMRMMNSTAGVESNGTKSQAINVDDDKCGRTEKRMLWTKEEDLRLVSAWLKCSNDPIQSNFRKNDHYWKDVADIYNSTTPKNRVRQVKNIKDHFLRIKRRVQWFCGSWKEANALWASGESDADIKAKALKSYEEEHKKDGPFMFKHCWEVLQKEPKWEAYLERLEHLEQDKRKFCEEDDVGKCFSLDDDANCWFSLTSLLQRVELISL